MRKTNNNKKNFLAQKRIAKKYRGELIKNETDAERVFKYILDKLKVKYKAQYIVYLPSKFYIVDFYIPHKKVVFEIDGYHHYTATGLSKDNLRDSHIATLNMEIHRFRNKEVYNPRKCERRIKKILGIKQNKFF